ncbi:hypothetical protein RHMOL_Rhmol03G0013900 [Rhododendron molle]|uniref:Uncharacterized protein n=1 Tax=Rhododendron molle TaxID=49168 RepID=A0ACC0P9R0_RHOML|nr:hypothetical protein RHMOL_Rhmol03G0013900 [Rhododendron molle]
MKFWNLAKITRIWDDQPLSEPEKEAKSFSELEHIFVDFCDQLEYVLPSYMLPQLKNLQELHIQMCTKVEVIISNNPKEKEATNNNDTIRFPQLKTLNLGWLPIFKSFICSDETQSIFSNKVVFPVLKRVSISNFDKITRIWNDQPLSELEDIRVKGCTQLEYILPFYMLPQLKNLQELHISGCTKVEVIISNNPKEKEATNNKDTIRFPQLKTLALGDLPNLKSFVCSETQLLFSNEDVFPVLVGAYYLDKFFRNKISTKEECGTSGKESDNNGKELDEDLETPTKEECSTSGKEKDHNGEELDEDLETPMKKVSMEIKLFTDTESFLIMGKAKLLIRKEHALVISNHKNDIDWLVGWVLAQRFGCLGSSLAVMKKSSKFLPEKVAGAKLMASLMAREAPILESIVGGLLDARTVLSSILSSSDTSPEVQEKSSGGDCYEKLKP